MGKKPLIHPLTGIKITIVAKKEDEPNKEKNMLYKDALIAMKQFKKLGWRVDLYEIGFNK